LKIENGEWLEAIATILLPRQIALQFATPSSMKGKFSLRPPFYFPFIDEGVDAEGRRGSRNNG
jgi:hypothetical protein